MRDLKISGILLLVVLLTSFVLLNPEFKSPTGYSIKQVAAYSEPNHSFILPGILLLIVVIGSHSLSHCCRHEILKKYLTISLAVSLILLVGVFGLSVFSPTGRVAMATQRLSSILAAVGILFVFIVGAFELLISQKNDKDAHKWDEDAEEKWDKKR